MSRWPGSKYLLVAGQALVTAAVALFVLRRVDLRGVWAHLEGISVLLVVASFALHLVRVPLSGHRWRLLLEHYGHRFGTAYLTRTIFASQFFATVLPGASAVDLVRSYYLYRRGVSPRHVLVTVLADRGAGVVSLLLLSLAPAVWVLWNRPAIWPVSLTVLGLVAVAAGAAYLLERPTGLSAAPPRLLALLRGRLAPLVGDLASLVMDRPLLLRVLALSLLFQLVSLVAVYLIGRGVHADTSFSYYLLFVPLIWLWTSLPISINGIGVREGAFVFYFGLVGMPAETALAMSVLVSAQAVALGLAGGIVVPFGPRLRPLR